MGCYPVTCPVRQKALFRKRIYKTRDLARAEISAYIEVFYNRARSHSHPGGASPDKEQSFVKKGCRK